jgi:hypothetical protein
MILLLNKVKKPIFSAWGWFEVNRDYYCMVSTKSIIELDIFKLSNVRAGDFGLPFGAKNLKIFEYQILRVIWNSCVFE